MFTVVTSYTNQDTSYPTMMPDTLDAKPHQPQDPYPTNNNRMKLSATVDGGCRSEVKSSKSSAIDVAGQ